MEWIGWVAVAVVFNLIQWYQYRQYASVLKERSALLVELLTLARRTGQSKAFVEDALWRAYPRLQRYALKETGGTVPAPSSSASDAGAPSE